MAYNPPIGSIYHLYTTYILPSGGLYATYHPLQESEKSIDFWWLCVKMSSHTIFEVMKWVHFVVALLVSSYFGRTLAKNYLQHYTPVIQHSWLENGHGLKIYFLLNMGIFQPAMLVYWRVV